MHSLALCVQWGFEKLPSAISTIIQKIPAHFSYSGIRREEFLKIQEKFLEKKEFQEFNEFVDQERLADARAPNPFQRHSATRFLVKGPLLKKILLNWPVLLDYFTQAERCAPVNQRGDIRQILEILNNCTFKLMLSSIVPIILEFESLNAKFQSSNPELLELQDELELLFRTTERRIYESDQSGRLKKLHYARADLGWKFDDECQKLISSKQVNSDQVRSVRETLCSFIYELYEQLKQRVPATRVSLESYAKMRPEKIINTATKMTFTELLYR